MTRQLAAVEPERRLLDSARAAAYLGISESNFKDKVAKDAKAGAGEFLKIPLGHRVLFDKADLDEYIERRKKAAR